MLQNLKEEDAKTLSGLAIDRFKNPRQSENIEQEISDKSKHNRIIRKGKKIIGSNVSQGTQHLSGDLSMLTFPQWTRDKGIDIRKIDEKSTIYDILRNQYDSYLNDFSLVEQFIEYIARVKPLENFSID